MVERAGVERVLDRLLQQQQTQTLDENVDLRQFIQILSPFEQPKWKYDLHSKSYMIDAEHVNDLWGTAEQLVSLGQDRYDAARMRLTRAGVTNVTSET